MRTKAFRYLWIGQACANLGDVLYIVALIAAVYEATGSAMLMTAVPFVITFSKFISSVLAPLMMGKWRLKRLLSFSQSAKTFFLFVLTAAVFTEGAGLSAVLVLAAVIAFLDGWALPATNAMVPYLVHKGELLRTNGFLTTVNEVIHLCGWAGGGALTALLQPEGTLFVTALLYTAASVFMHSLPVSPSSPKRESAAEGAKKLAGELAEGWISIWKMPSLRLIHGAYILSTIASVVWIAAVMYIFVEERLHAGTEWWGFINGAFFAGVIAGGVLLLRFHRFFEQRQTLTLIGGTILASLFTFCFGVSTVPFLALIFSLLFGVFDEMRNVILHTRVQMEAPTEKLGKVFAAQNALNTLLFGLAVLASGVAAEHYGTPAVFVFSSILLLASAIPLHALAKK